MAAPKTGDPRVGIRVTAPLASIVAGATTTMLYQGTPGTTFIIRKISWNNRNGAASRLRIGSTNSAVGGVAGVFTQRLVEIFMPAGQHGFVDEDDGLPGWEYRISDDEFSDSVGQS